MDTTLAYLRESLSNHVNRSTGQRIYKKLQNHYQNEEEFVRDLDEEEISFLNSILKDEISYAQNEKDEKRVHQLNEVYELLI
ncbi:sigma-G-dependent sporulation-specific acid-soluble spore protein CsgA [Heyndrickxia oleronia]|uniref:Sporulation protein n=1 Tax=Heyndrickxia oleronia TaxID=38875 RepID=A0A8E2I9R2_9BACI|nr:sigma-G-dependent sporulation-specific acid-soluble spore protein CsgA [Heyndrickxia oleronia]NYV65534.1 sigma-G-dependent sporulation-specific acid-soluble spore protein CsgA [Bacillus sp. Gen3]OJH20535.1 sporulation protein [Bacillus obstructivus]MBU5210184.1 sigma-G-dependent sporulation-specific acid-soluble spore protein CsgA [Heyndrickxia oleronia]MCI1592986.1 sigma-G-dependent sporulation-specific acid-soluble spore protein CsgA [Heyndrickxia oleronia]MCI1615137.1 sigma-G-dependent s